MHSRTFGSSQDGGKNNMLTCRHDAVEIDRWRDNDPEQEVDYVGRI